MSAAAANFQNTRGCRDQISIVFRQQFPVKAAAFSRLCRSRLIERAKLIEVLLEQRRNWGRRQNVESVPTRRLLAKTGRKWQRCGHAPLKSKS